MDDNHISGAMASIAEATVISILFPYLRRSLVVDVRRDEEHEPLVQVLPQVNSVEERMKSIDKLRPGLGRVRSILAIPWMRSLRDLEEAGITRSLAERLTAAGLERAYAQQLVDGAMRGLRGYEQMARARMIAGQGFATLWTESKR